MPSKINSKVILKTLPVAEMVFGKISNLKQVGVIEAVENLSILIA